MFFSEDFFPQSVLDVLLWPGLLFIIAVLIGYFAFRVEWDGKEAPWKWAALIPLALGLVIGLSAMLLLVDVNYDNYRIAAGAGRKVTYALWGTLVLPILGFVGYAAWRYWTRTQKVRY